MSTVNLNDAYRASVETFLDTMFQQDKVFEDSYIHIDKPENEWTKQDRKDFLDSQDAKTTLFTRCYELTMTYLQAREDLRNKSDRDNPENKMNAHEKNAARIQVERIKEAGKVYFNALQNRGICFDAPGMKPYQDFFNSFYNQVPCDTLEISKMVQSDLDKAQERFQTAQQDIQAVLTLPWAENHKRKMDAENKFTSPEYTEACEKFAKNNEFIKMVKLALQADNKDIMHFSEHIVNMERKAKSVQEQGLVESKLTEKGFVTHTQFSCIGDSRNDNANAIERFTLSTLYANNRINQEINHGGIGSLKMYSVMSQRTLDGSKKWENAIDVVRGLAEFHSRTKEMREDVVAILSGFTNYSNDPQVQQKAEEALEKAQRNMDEKMTQCSIGRDRIEMQEVPLFLLRMEMESAQSQRKPANNDVAMAGIAKDISIRFTKEMKDIVEVSLGIKEQKQAPETFIEKAKQVVGETPDRAMELFDKARYDNLRGALTCDGQWGLSSLRFTTQLMSRGEAIKQRDPIEYQKAMDLLQKTFSHKLDLYVSERDERDRISSQNSRAQSHFFTNSPIDIDERHR